MLGVYPKKCGTITSDVQMSGRVASMGRGIMQDVSGRIIDQFSENLAAMLTGGQTEAEPEPAPAESPAPGGEPQAAAGNGSPSAAAAAEPPTVPEPPKAPALPKAADAELSATGLAGAVIAGRLQDPKVLAGVVAGAVAVGYLLGRR